MKANLKKVFAAVLALTLVVSVVGCGKKNQEGWSKDGKTYEVVWYNSETPQPDYEEVYEAVSKYTKEKIGVTVKYVPFTSAEYAEKLNLAFASKKRVDMCFASTGTKFQQYARQQAYYDMTPYLDGIGKETKALFPEYALDCFKVGGVQFGIPVLKDWAFQPMVATSQWKLDAAGITNEEWEGVETLADFEPIFKKWRAATTDMDGNKVDRSKDYGILMRGNHNLMKFLPQETIDGSVLAGFSFAGDYTKVINVFETKEFADLLDLVRGWYQAGYIKKDANVSTSDADLWKIGNYLATHGEWLPYYGCTVEEGEPDKAIYARKLCNPRMATTQVSMCGLAMPNTGNAPEKTMEFINLIYGDAYVRNLIGYGIEGKHWVKDGENHYALPEGAADKASTGYSSTISSTGNRYLLKVAPKTPDDIWEQYQNFNSADGGYGTVISPAIGFAFDPQPVTAEIAAVSTVYNEYFKDLIVGAVDPKEKLPEFLKKLEDVGAKEIIKEAQTQYDEWRLSK